MRFFAEIDVRDALSRVRVPIVVATRPTAPFITGAPRDRPPTARA
jgi:hypothetical protein